MLFIAQSHKYTPKGLVKIKIKRIAKYHVYHWKLSGNDIAVDNYCKQKYNKSLKEVCWYIIDKIKVFISNDENQYIIILEDKNLDKLAHIITYGNGEIGGSQILQKAFIF